MPDHDPVRTLLSRLRPTWMRDALCAEPAYVNVDWFPASTGDQSARAVCARCLVRETCLSYALDNRIDHGTWGGLEPDERRVLARELGLPSAAEATIDQRRARVAALTAQGRTAGQIAEALGCTPRLVRGDLRAG